MAGIPATTVPAGTDFVTTALAPTMAPSPISVPGITHTFSPIQTRFPMRTGEVCKARWFGTVFGPSCAPR